MNNLFLHIQYLLLRNDCVIVPGLGAFIATRTRACIDMENGIVSPAERNIVFNSAVASDDGMLSRSYARKYNLSYEDGRKAVIHDVENLLNILNTDGSIDCGKLGVLKCGEEGNIEYLSSPLAQIKSSLMGFDAAPLNYVKPADRSQNEIPNSLDDNIRNDNDDAYYYFRIKKSTLRIAASFVAVMAICLSIFLNPFPSDEREQRASIVPVEAFINAPAKKSEHHSGPASECRESSDSNIETNDTLVATTPTYHLIVGTFSSEKEARSFVSKFSNDDFPLTLVPSRKLTRVAVASSHDIGEIRKKLNSSDISSRYENPWIWTEK